nr:phytanoyl-CoA dioxygenase family protein [Brevundimonas subvibrioides]
MTREDFWRETFPEMTICGAVQDDDDFNEISPNRLAMVSERLRVEGYFQEADPELVRLSGLLSLAIDRAASLSIPPVFVFLFDEAWRVFNRQKQTLASILGDDYQVMPAFWAWRIDPQAGEAGWRPHRDLGARGLRADGTPKLVNAWVPLTEASPANGCMYILPANRDPVYGTADEKNWKVDYPSIRALPGKPGDWFCWNQAVLHWGGQTSQFCHEPRMSIALEFQRGDEPAFNKPLLGTLPNLGFEDRLKMVAKQILQFQHMYALPQSMRDLATQIVG